MVEKGDRDKDGSNAESEALESDSNEDEWINIRPRKKNTKKGSPPCKDSITVEKVTNRTTKNRTDKESRTIETRKSEVHHEDDESISVRSCETRSTTKDSVTIQDRVSNKTKRKEKTYVTCELCNKDFAKRSDGLPWAHKCSGFGGMTNCSDIIGENGEKSQLAKNRDRARDKSIMRRKSRGLPLKNQQLVHQPDEDDDEEQHSSDVNPPVNAQLYSENKRSRESRRREKTKGIFLKTLKERLAKAAEPELTKGEFTLRMEHALALTPQDARRIHREGESQDKQKRAEAALIEQELREENEVIGRDDINGQISSKSAAEYSSVQDKLKRMDKAMKNGDISKAHSALMDKGIYDVQSESGSALLDSKYPKDINRREQGNLYIDSLENKTQYDQPVCDKLTNFENVQNFLSTRINRKKNGASAAATGLSNDHIKAILRTYPETLTDLTVVCGRIAGGSITAGTASYDLNTGKGTALIKGESDLRPINTQHPFSNLAGSAIVKHNEATIQEQCGKEQLAFLSGSTEINGHLVRAILESNPKFACGTMDVKNAYGSPRHETILRSIQNRAPELTPFSNMQMGQEVREVIFLDPKSGATQVQQVERGVAQGGAASTAQFCLTLNDQVVSHLASGHPHLWIFCISDNISVLGESLDVIDALEHGFKLLKDNMDSDAQIKKSTIYGLGNDYPDEARQRAEELGIKWIESSNGFNCAGTPIGSTEYMIEAANLKADEIIEELDTMKKLAASQHTKSYKNLNQTLFAIMRLCTSAQFTFLARVLPPSVTRHAALRIDTAIVNTVTFCSDIVKYLPPPHTQRLQQTIDQIFQPIRDGGLGFMSVEESCKGAYVGSILLCAGEMSSRFPSLIEWAEEGNLPASLKEFEHIVTELQTQGIKAVEKIDVGAAAMWETSNKKMQAQINRELLNKKKERLLAETMPTGVNREDRFDPEGPAVRIQRLSNLDSHANAWMTGNPSFGLNKMSNDDHSIAIATRLCLPVMGTRSHCACGEKIDSLGLHIHDCPVTTVRVPIRHDLHNSIKSIAKKCLQMGTKGGGYTIEDGEPRVSDFLEPRQQRPRRNGSINSSESFSDIAIQKTSADGEITTILIDATTVAVGADYVQKIVTKDGKTYAPGDAGNIGEDEKKEHYEKLFHLDQHVLHPVQMATFSIETTGAVGTETRKLINELAVSIAKSGGIDGDEEDDGVPLKQAIDLSLRQLKQIISVSLQAWRARTVRKSIKYFTLDSRPNFPYTPGSNCSMTRPDPPAFIGLPANLGRTHAVTPLPARPPPSTNRLLRRS